VPADITHSDPLRFDLLVEVVPGESSFGHLPALPGLCFRAKEVSNLESVALAQIAAYARWLLAEGLVDLTPEAAAVVHRLRTDSLAAIQVIEVERREGWPLWVSGNPAVLFRHDHQPLGDPTVAAHLRFTRQVLSRIRTLVEPLSAAQGASKAAPDRRSIDQTLTHIGNCIWWYCSRIDDELPEPEGDPDELPLDRIDRLLEDATEFLIGIPLGARSTVHVPTRFPTKDSSEPWTHAKVCRRQAEHVWEHLPGIQDAVAGAFGYDA